MAREHRHVPRGDQPRGRAAVRRWSSSAKTTSTRPRRIGADHEGSPTSPTGPEGYGIPGRVVDGMDVVAVHRVGVRGRGSRPAAAKARRCSNTRPTGTPATREATPGNYRDREELEGVAPPRPARPLPRPADVGVRRKAPSARRRSTGSAWPRSSRPSGSRSRAPIRTRPRDGSTSTPGGAITP